MVRLKFDSGVGLHVAILQPNQQIVGWLLFEFQLEGSEGVLLSAPEQLIVCLE